MVVCKMCNGEMLEVKGCKCIKFEYADGKVMDPIKFGDEEDDWGDESCGDCGCKVGGYHHSGCDVERCPRCTGQAISCECEMVGDE